MLHPRIYNLNDPRFRESVASRWYRAINPDPRNPRPQDSANATRLVNPTDETLTVEWFIYLGGRITNAAAVCYWPWATNADRIRLGKLQAQYNGSKITALAQGYQFSKSGYVTPPAKAQAAAE